MALTKTTAPRILDLDIENRPLNYAGQDFTFGEITAIAWCFVGQRNPTVRLLPEDPLQEMLPEFVGAWNEADLVTGHNLIKHDLRALNGMLLELRMEPLHPKLVCDTYLHLKRKSLVSASQENLAAMLGIKAPKVSMSQASWRQANRLLPEGVEKTRKRVAGDVRQHMALRKKLIELDWLNPPRPWKP